MTQVEKRWPESSYFLLGHVARVVTVGSCLHETDKYRACNELSHGSGRRRVCNLVLLAAQLSHARLEDKLAILLLHAVLPLAILLTHEGEGEETGELGAQHDGSEEERDDDGDGHAAAYQHHIHSGVVVVLLNTY